MRFDNIVFAAPKLVGVAARWLTHTTSKGAIKHSSIGNKSFYPIASFMRAPNDGLRALTMAKNKVSISN